MADDFWQALGGFGNALSAIPKGLDAGMQPMKTLEDIQKQSLANDATGITNRNAELLQLGREGQQVPSYYGDYTQQMQTGFQKGTAENQLGTYNTGQDLAFRQYLTSPQGQAEFQGLQPGMSGWDAKMQEILGRFTPYGTANTMGVPDFQSKVLGPAQNRAGGQQISEEFLRQYAAGVKDPATGEPYGPGAQVQFLPNGQISVTSADGRPIDVGQNALTVAQQWAGNTAPYTAYNQRQVDQRTGQVAYNKMITDTITAMQGKAGSDPTANSFVNLAKIAEQRLKDNGVQRQKIQAVPYWDDPTEKQRQLDALDAADATAHQDIVRYSNLVEQTAAQRRGGMFAGGGGGRYPVPGFGGTPGGVPGPGGIPGGARGAFNATAGGVSFVPGSGGRIGSRGTGGPRAGASAPGVDPAVAAAQQAATVGPGTEITSSLGATEQPYGYVPPYMTPLEQLLRSFGGGTGGAGGAGALGNLGIYPPGYG